jgi:RES domain-containing protein
MIVYRVVKETYADDLSGKGSELSGGRWNRKGIPALYAAATGSLAMLETIVHCSRIEDLYGRIIAGIEVPDQHGAHVSIDDLPPDWRTIPWNSETVDFGSDWLSSRKGLYLRIPSVVIPSEYIFLLNPSHPEYSSVRITSKTVFSPDPRLLKKRG